MLPSVKVKVMHPRVMTQEAMSRVAVSDCRSGAGG